MIKELKCEYSRLLASAEESDTTEIMNDLKEKGKAAFLEKDYGKAAELYGHAIDQDPTDAVLFSNRAQCYLNLKNWKKAMEDCTEGLERSPTSNIKEKLLYRKALAARALGQITLAATCLGQVLRISSSNQVARTQLAEVNSILDHSQLQASKKLKSSLNGSQIPIEVVDSLPEKYATIVDPPTVPKVRQPANLILVEKMSEELFLDRPAKQLSKLSTNITFVERPAMLKLRILDHLLPDVRVRAFKPILELSKLDILELGDIEPEFLELFIDSGTYGLLSNLVKPTQLLERLKAVLSLARYKISLQMCSSQKISGLLNTVEDQLPHLLQSFTNILS